MTNENRHEDKNCHPQEVQERREQEARQEAENGAENIEAQSRLEEQAAGRPEEQLASKLAEKTEEAAALFNRLQRLQADFENYRRRVRREQEELVNYATEKLIAELLPVLDNLERALEAAAKGGELSSFINGVDMIYRQLLGILEKQGLMAMETVGHPFNPETHHAVMQVETEDHEDNKIIEQVLKGYLLKEKVLRTAMVKVAKALQTRE
ncbi:MAG: nucleotide exchange factor GrpE [Bacillota bacterium]